MFRRLGQLYARRIVNVNVNIVLAGVLALLPTLAVVKLTEHMLRSGIVSAERLHIGAKALITGVTFFADVFFDVTIYYALHWLANHSGKAKRQERLEDIAEAAAENVPFFRDATKVQLQRMVLSPLLYLIFLGGQFTLMTWLHVPPVYATVIGFFAGVAVARTLHTFWMLGEERGRALVLAGKVCGKCGYDLSRIGREFDRCPECGLTIPRPLIAAAAAPTPAAIIEGSGDGPTAKPADRAARPFEREPVSKL